MNIIGEKIGTVCISVYRDAETGLPFFYVKSDNDNVIQISYVIEDMLHKY